MAEDKVLWWAKVGLSSWGTIMLFGAVGIFFGWDWATGLGLLVLTYLVGFLHGVGSEITKASSSAPGATHDGR